MFACIHVPDFIVESLVRHHPELRHKAVAVVDGKPPVWTVVALNRAARDAGVQTGMTKLQVEQFFEAAVRQRSMAQEASAQAALLDCGAGFSPRVEDTGPGTVVLDIDGLEHLFGSAEKLAGRLSRHASELGLTAHVAIASNPDTAEFAAKIGARRRLPGFSIVAPGAEADRLHDFPIDVLPLNAEDHHTLARWGIRTLGALAQLPARALSERLGQKGVHYRSLAAGATSRPLHPRPEPLQFTESMELDDGITTLEPLTFIVNRLCDSLFCRLRSRNLAAQAIHLRLQRERPHDPFTCSLQLPVPARNPRVVTRLFMLDLDKRPPGAPVIGVHIDAVPAKYRVVQNGLFVPLSPEPEKLELTMARIAAIVGQENVGSPELENTYARDRIRMKHFCGTPVLSVRETPGQEGRGALRLFRPAREATVRTKDGIPAWIAFSGAHGDIAIASGPWHSSGDWWTGQHWNREEWDVQMAASIVLRIYRDAFSGRWYAEGIYD